MKFYVAMFAVFALNVFGADATPPPSINTPQTLDNVLVGNGAGNQNTFRKLSANSVTSGVFSPSRLGTGTTNSSTVLLGDGSWTSNLTGLSVNPNFGAQTIKTAPSDLNFGFQMFRPDAVTNALFIYTNSNNPAMSFRGSTSGGSTIGVATTGADCLFQLPPSNGTNGDVLTTDGFGVTTWAAGGATGAAGGDLTGTYPNPTASVGGNIVIKNGTNVMTGTAPLNITESSGSHGYQVTPLNGTIGYILEATDSTAVGVFSMYNDPTTGINATFGGPGASNPGLQTISTIGTYINGGRYLGFSQAAGNPSAFVDVALYRNAVGVLEIDNGTSGTYRDLQTRNQLMSGTFTNYNGVVTTGNGVPSIYGSDRKTAQTAAVNLATYTVGAADASYLVSANVLVTSSTLHNFTITCSYTSEDNTARVLTMQTSSLAGAFVTAITNAAGAVPYEGVPLHLRCKAGSTIVVGTTGTFTTVAYNIEECIQQIK